MNFKRLEIEKILSRDDELSLQAMRFPLFYRTFAVRTVTNVINPVVSSVEKLELPLASVLHYVSYDDVLLGPDPKSPLLIKHTGRVLVDHVGTLVPALGKPLIVGGMNVDKLRRTYHARVKQYRYLTDFDRSSREDKTLIVFNYALLNKMYRYTSSMYMNLYKWYNIWSTVFSTIAEKVKLSDRQHFVLINLPDFLPDIAVLKKAMGNLTGLTKEGIEVFSSPENMFILQLWTWLAPPIQVKGKDGKTVSQRRDNIIDVIPQDKLSKVNLIWLDNGSWVTMNLGTYIELAKLGTEESPDGSSTNQLRFMKMLINVMGGRSELILNDTPVADGEVQSDDDVKNDKLTRSQIDQLENLKEQGIVLDGRTANPYDDVEDIPIVVDEPDIHTPLSSKQVDDDKLTVEDIQKDLDVLSKINKRREEDKSVVVIKPNPSTPRDRLMAKVDGLADQGIMTAAEYRRVQMLVEKMDKLPNVFGEGTLSEHANITPEMYQISDKYLKKPKIRGVLNQKNMESTVTAMSKQYVKEMMTRHLAKVVMSLQQVGLIVTNVERDETVNVGDHFQTLKIQVAPIEGQTSTLSIRIPMVDDESNFLANGVKWKMKWQKADLPIRKVSPFEVALTTYYAKAFVTRSQKMVVKYPAWLNKQLNLLSIGEGKTITGIRKLNVYTNEVRLPRIYSTLAMKYRQFTHKKQGVVTQFFFDYKDRSAEFGADVLRRVEKDGLLICGKRGNEYIVVDMDNMFYLSEGKGYKELGKFYDVVGIDKQPPTEVAEFSLFTKQVPVGILLGQYYGLKGLLARLGVVPRSVYPGQRMNLTPDEFSIAFSDEVLIIPRTNKVVELIMSGFNRYHLSIKNYTIAAFNDKDVYTNILEENGFKIGFVRELGLAFDAFVDPMTYEVLTRMKEPTTLVDLLVRSCELLTTDWAPDEMDETQMYYRGYERFSAHMYAEIMKAVRVYRSRGAGKKAVIGLPPDAVWLGIVTDSSTSPIEESNVIQSTKEKDLFTFSGTWGRSKQSMTKATRAYHKRSVGVVSEGGVDSGAVGINAYLSPNATFKDLTGMTESKPLNELDPSSLLSRSALISPYSDNDDMRRIGFIGIQHAHGVACNGYRPSPLRTDFHKAIAHETVSMFSTPAEGEGVVREINEFGITIEYKDKSVKQYQIGTRYGNVTGTTVPQRVKTDLVVGEKVKEGTILTYNSGFFEPDPLDKGQVLWKPGVLAKVAILERKQTFEDACMIHPRLAEQFKTQLTEVRTILVRFDQEVHDLVKVGTEVDLESILCTIEDGVTSESGLFEGDSLETLTALAARTPSANVKGLVENLEVLYHGDVEDMSESVRAIVDASDKRRKKMANQLGKPVVTGRIGASMRVNKQPLDLDTVAIQIYITKTLTAGVGDKGVLANQLKTIVSGTMLGEHISQSGIPIDIYFSYLAIAARIVESPEKIGTTITLQKVMSLQIADAFFN